MMVSVAQLETSESTGFEDLEIEPMGTFNILAASLKAAGLTRMLAEDSEYTVFAPTDDAFAKLPEGTLAKLLQDKDRLRTMLKYHMVPGKVTVDQIKQMPSTRTLAGHPIHIWNCTSCSKVWINGAEIVDSDIFASNGIVHAIDMVLLP